MKIKLTEWIQVGGTLVSVLAVLVTFTSYFENDPKTLFAILATSGWTVAILAIVNFLKNGSKLETLRRELDDANKRHQNEISELISIQSELIPTSKIADSNRGFPFRAFSESMDLIDLEGEEWAKQYHFGMIMTANP